MWQKAAVVCVVILAHYTLGQNTTATPQSTAAGATHSNMTEAPQSNITGATHSNMTEATQSTAAGAPQSTTAGAPQSTITGAPQSTMAGAPQSTVAGAPQSTMAGAPQSTVAGAPQSTMAGAPQSTVAGAPQSTMAGAPQSTVAGAPQSTATGAPETSSPSAGTPAATPAPTTIITTTTAAPTTITSTAPTTTTTATTTATTTTTTPAPTRPPSRPAPIIVLRVVLLIVFRPGLTNSQSPVFQQEAAQVENDCDVIYRRRFRFRFVRTIVRAFRLRNRRDNVETDVDLVFNENSTEPLPQASEVVSTLREALNDSTLNISLPVDPASITVISSPRSAGIPQFRTNETFTADLLVSNSIAFINRSSLIKRQLEPFFFEDFQPDFISLTPRSFSNGSIVHMTDITVTANGTIPNDTQTIATLTRAALSGNLSFTITFINGTAVSAGEVSSKVNLMTACGLTFLSLLVARPW